MNAINSTSELKNKLKYLFYKPGWLPEEMGGYQPPSAVDKSSYQKFNTFSDKHLNYYILIQYVVALGATAFFLFNYAQWSLVYQLLGVTGIGLTVLSAGGLLENKPWSLRLEMSRHILIFIGSMHFSYLYNINTLWIVSTLYILISIFTFPRNQLKTSLHK